MIRASLVALALAVVMGAQVASPCHHTTRFTGYGSGRLKMSGGICASLAVSAGANVLAVSRMLGHKDPSMTLRIYADLFDSDLDAVAERLDSGWRGDRAGTL
jgi:integrase